MGKKNKNIFVYQNKKLPLQSQRKTNLNTFKNRIRWQKRPSKGTNPT
jgi:hypothetical protein